MNTDTTIQMNLSKVVGLMRQYFVGRLKKEPIQYYNAIIRDLRIVLQQVITDYFIQLPLAEGKKFRASFADQLISVTNECYVGHESEDKEHRQYCIREIMACFEWAEQIKIEAPDDPVIQKILAIDIPILRPFDYGLQKGKGPSHHSQHNKY